MLEKISSYNESSECKIFIAVKGEKSSVRERDEVGFVQMGTTFHTFFFDFHHWKGVRDPRDSSVNLNLVRFTSSRKTRTPKCGRLSDVLIPTISEGK